MKHLLPLAFLAIALAGCATKSSRHGEETGGCSTVRELPPLRLTAQQKELLARVSRTQPRTALDYYMLLPKSYFSIMPDSPERRITYVDTKTLTDDFLEAHRWFECDGGGFEVQMKLYRTPGQTYVAIRRGTIESIFDDGKPTEGEPSVSINRPSLWTCDGRAWSQEPEDSVPVIPAQRVLAKYHRDWDADRQWVGQEKFISLDYVLSPATDDVVIMGRENFQPSIYEYARLKWRQPRFVLEMGR